LVTFIGLAGNSLALVQDRVDDIREAARCGALEVPVWRTAVIHGYLSSACAAVMQGLTFVGLLIGHWLFGPLQQMGADVCTVFESDPAIAFSTAVHIADAPIELLQSVPRSWSIALHLFFEFTDASAPL
jgi:hypothetical protein